MTASIIANVAIGAPRPWAACRRWFGGLFGSTTIVAPAVLPVMPKPAPVSVTAPASAPAPLPYALPPTAKAAALPVRTTKKAGPHLSKKKRLAQLDETYSVAWMLAHPPDHAIPKRVAHDMLEEFQDIVSSDETPKQLAARLARWIKSDLHALYVAQSLREFGDRAAPLLQELVAHNPYFSEVHAVDGGKGYLVTSSFDIEDDGPGFTQLYRPRFMSDEDWKDLSVARRQELMFGFKSDLVPTAQRPPYLGEPSTEYAPGSATIPEVKHHSYEIRLDRALAQVAEISKIKGNTHSIHVHLNAEFPERYDYLNEMHAWHHQRSAYLTFRGLEENLLPARSIEVSPDGAGKVEKWGGLVNKRTTLGLRTNQGDDHNHDIFGDAVMPGHIKVDLELRDATRKLDQLGRYARTIAGELQTRPWEQKHLDTAGMIDLSDAKRPEWADAALGSAGLAAEVSRTVAYQFPLASLPFVDFAKVRFFDFRTGKPRPALKSFEIARLTQARDAYAARLKKLEKEIIEINGMPQHARQPYLEAMELAIGEDIAIWAREAKVSELFPDHQLHR